MVRTAYVGWNRLNELGRQYYEEVKRGYDTQVDQKTSLRNRSNSQVELANKIIEGSLMFIRKIAYAMLNNGQKIKRLDGGLSNLRLKDFYRPFDADDLVGYGIEGIIEGLHRYDPSKGSISTFLVYATCPIMYRKANENGLIVSLPSHECDKALRIIRSSRSKREIIDRLSGGIEAKKKRALIIYNIIKGRYVDIDHRANDKEDSPSNDKWGDRYLADENSPNPEELINNTELADISRKVLNTLMPREERMLMLRFGIGEKSDSTLEEVAQDFWVTRERARQIEAKALRKMRHPARHKHLKEFIAKQ